MNHNNDVQNVQTKSGLLPGKMYGKYVTVSGILVGFTKPEVNIIYYGGIGYKSYFKSCLFMVFTFIILFFHILI